MKRDYIARINRVIDYIEKNVAEELTLEKLANVAYFSPFHFHRIFSAFVGETLFAFIKRMRLEKSANMLVYNLDASITDIALEVGFGDSSTFSRAFRDHFGMSASEFRGGGYHEIRNTRKQKSKDRQTNSNSDQDKTLFSDYFVDENLNIQQRSNEMKVEVKEMPKMHVAYVRHIGPYGEIGQAFKKICNWAGARGLFRPPQSLVLGVYHDSTEITEESKLRSSACITVPENTVVEGEVGKMDIEPGKYAVSRFEISKEQFQESWDSLAKNWLPDSGYQFDNRLCYEIYLNDHMTHPEQKFIVDICIPIKPQ